MLPLDFLYKYRTCGIWVSVETVTYPNGDRVQNFILILRAVEWEGSLACLDGESLALEFFDLADLPTLMPNDRPVLEKFQEYKKSGKFLMF